MLILALTAAVKLAALPVAVNAVAWFVGKVVEAHRIEREILAELAAKDAAY